MSGLGGLGHPEPVSLAEVAGTLRFIAEDHPCCAFAAKSMADWLFEQCEYVAKDGEIEFASADEDEVRNFIQVAKCNGIAMKIFRREKWFAEIQLEDD